LDDTAAALASGEYSGDLRAFGRFLNQVGKESLAIFWDTPSDFLVKIARNSPLFELSQPLTEKPPDLRLQVDVEFFDFFPA
jgi:hypothetical protein